jgi:hypothetical protein
LATLPRSLVSSSLSSFSSSSTVTVMLPLLWFNLWFKVARATADFFYKSLLPPFVWSSWLVKRWLRDLRSAVRWSSSILTLLGLCAAAPQRLSPRDPCRCALTCICMLHAWKWKVSTPLGADHAWVMHTRTNTHAYARVHTHTQSQPHTHTHTHTHTHIPMYAARRHKDLDQHRWQPLGRRARGPLGTCGSVERLKRMLQLRSGRSPSGL